MITLFENDDFILKSTGHDYDFVGIIETKTDAPLTFFFSEELCGNPNDGNIDESQTKLLDVYSGLKDEDGYSETDELIFELGADSFFRTRDDKSTGFLSDQRERGQFLALIKNYCPEQLAKISWA